jgi:hypothetical protein
VLVSVAVVLKGYVGIGGRSRDREASLVERDRDPQVGRAGEYHGLYFEVSSWVPGGGSLGCLLGGDVVLLKGSNVSALVHHVVMAHAAREGSGL